MFYFAGIEHRLKPGLATSGFRKMGLAGLPVHSRSLTNLTSVEVFSQTEENP